MATFVLVHGGYGGGWQWKEVAMRLRGPATKCTRPP